MCPYVQPYFNTWREELYYEMSLRRIALLIYFRTQTMLLRMVLRALLARITCKTTMKVLQGRINHRIWRLEVKWTHGIALQLDQTCRDHDRFAHECTNAGMHVSKLTLD